MFQLFYLYKDNKFVRILTDNELKPCLDYINNNKYDHTRYVIISPNNRRITINTKNDLVFSNIQ